MKRKTRAVVLDASLRFARSNPEVMRYAYMNAGPLNVPVDDLLLDAIGRVVASRGVSGTAKTRQPAARRR